MWNRPELRSIYFYEWNQQINFSNYGRETLTRFTFSGSTKCHSSKQLSPRSQVPVSIPTAQLPHVTAELSQHALWLRLQTQFLYYIRGEGMLMVRYSKYNEKKKCWQRAERQGPNLGVPPGGYVTPKQATCVAAFNGSPNSVLNQRDGQHCSVSSGLSCGANKVYVAFSVVIFEHCSQIKAMMVCPHSLFTFA